MVKHIDIINFGHFYIKPNVKEADFSEPKVQERSSFLFGAEEENGGGQGELSKEEEEQVEIPKRDHNIFVGKQISIPFTNNNKYVI